MTSAAERRYLAHDEPPELEIAKTEGSFVFDSRGRRYIDFMMGWCVGNFGWGNARIERIAKTFRGPDYIYPGHAYAPWGELARLLISIAPSKLAKCFRATGGSEAVDLALQAAMVHTGRRHFLSIEDSYHGNTIATLSIAASENRAKYPNLLAGCDKIAPPLDDRALKRIEKRLAKRDVAAFIMEPISINLGVLIPDERFLPRLQRICRRHGTLLVVDEVATGFGRTGTVFACEQFDVEPDIMCLAKAITGGVAGMGAMLATAPVARSMEREGTFYSTYGWHPRSVEVAIATIEHIIRDRDRLLAHVTRLSDHFRERLSRIDFDSTAVLHIRGLAIGVDLDDEDYADEIETRCRRKGLLVSVEGSSLLLLPALNITRAIADEGLDILGRCV
jgi:adenosylmethionine-8-amino-7-oxononanoate aminotransferase